MNDFELPIFSIFISNYSIRFHNILKTLSCNIKNLPQIFFLTIKHEKPNIVLFFLLIWLHPWGLHYNKRGVYCDPNIIANNKEKSFWKPTVANHNFLQTLKLLRNRNIRTRTIASSSQLPKLIQSQNFSDYNFFYTSFAIPSTSEIICNKPITATT